MFSGSNPFWALAASIGQPIFAGGTLLHRQRAAEASFDQAAAQYKSVVIGAFQNVADALYSLQADADALAATVKSENAAKATLDLVNKQLALGQVNVLALLSSQQAYQQAVVARSQARASRLTDTAALFQALGGGWWNRTTTVEP
jgi:outer membrane protein TolC